MVLFLGLGLVLAVATQGAAGDVALRLEFTGKLDPKGIPEGWTLKARKGQPEIVVRDEAGRKVVYFRAQSASFDLEREVNLDVRAYPLLRWTWKVTQLPLGGDLRSGKTNDQATQLMLLFEGKKTISYVWDTTAPEGTVSDESIGWPLSLAVKVLVVRSGSQGLGEWVTFVRNVADDFVRLYGTVPPRLRGIRIQINSQHTGSTAEATFGEIAFSRADGAR